ncbi:manganese transport system permease protein [Neomicrococcus aestuarii]|uniref:Manganese transport system permease protein n=1 Tax=Neomicrococcus aestuarii TaxID=556325 RepID=A0A7W8TW23_9MICC|nr:metal ABC transporter permease [Neomicrococcus aestuarii]MBB5513878.1 manganese transport system permease protein [Neomicrococcus aestuarii]
MELLNWLTEPFAYGFMVNATLVTLAAAVVCGVLSCWLVLMGWALMGDAVSHAVLPGVALSFIFGVPFAIGALVFAMLAVFLIGGLRDSSRLKSDAATGVVFTALFALGIVIVSRTPSQVDLTHILFGNVLGTGPGELAQVLILGAITLVILLLKRKDLVLLAFDRVHAHALGLNAKALHALLLGLLALTVVASLQAMGTILVVAMLIIPGATAVLLTRSFSKMLVISVVLGLASTIVGVYASYYFDLATGASVVLAQAVFFAFAYLFSPRGGIIPQWRLRKTHAA